MIGQGVVLMDLRHAVRPGLDVVALAVHRAGNAPDAGGVSFHENESVNLS